PAKTTIDSPKLHQGKVRGVMVNSSRRQWLQVVSTTLIGAAAWPVRGAFGKRPESGKTCTLSIGTYSMKGIPLEKAIETIAGVGYDGIEIAVMSGFSEPEQMTNEHRKVIRRLLGDHRLKLTALMEHLAPATEAKQHQADLVRLRRTLE